MPLASSAIEAAKLAVHPILAAHAIATVVISYDGFGDEGQIEGVAAYDAAGNSVALPTVACLRHDSSDRGEVTASDATLATAMITVEHDWRVMTLDRDERTR